MVKKAKGKHRLDKFYHLAKEQGYRSRAAFKLIQLNRKYDFLSKCRSLLDLCAAPGGWLQVAVKTMPMSSLIIGVDLAPIRPIRGVKSFIGDITTQKCRQQLKKEAGGSLMDAVIHDGAPNVGGAWASEAYSQAALVLEALRLAAEFLAPRGTFVTKVFRSREYTALLYALKQLFDKVEATKPAASRNASAEIFVVCLGYKAPAKIDPRLLDPKHLFQEVQEAPKKMGPDALLKSKVTQKRWREGYEEGLSTMHKQAPAAAFILSDNPVQMLGEFTKFVVEGPGSDAVEARQDAGELAGFVARHPATTQEVATLCRDLQVLGRSEFKQLLKWRLQVKKDLEAHKDEDEDDKGKEQAEVDEETKEENREAALLAEMAGIKEAAEKRRKKEKKRQREARMKSRVRSAQMALGEGIIDEDAAPGQELFALASLKGAGAVSALGEAVAMDEDQMEEIARGSEDDVGDGVGDTSDADSEDERRRYDAMTEEALEEAYQSYRRRQGGREQAAAAKRQRLGAGGQLEDGPGSNVDVDVDVGPEDSEEEEEGGAGLLVELDERQAGRRNTPAAVAAQWFAQDIFDDPNVFADEVDPPANGVTGVADRHGSDADGTAANGVADHKPPAGAKRAAVGGVAGPQPAAKKGRGAGAAPAIEADSDEEGAYAAMAATGQKAARAASKQGADHDFEVAPQSPAGSDSDSEDDMDDLDDHSKAEMLALAKKMIRSKGRQQIVDEAYHRYAFHDDGLPKWFAEDEQRHMRRTDPLVSKQEVDDEKVRLRAIDARPIKKVAEAKARKRKRLAVKLTQARVKAEKIAGQEDVPMKAKMREIEKVYNRARSSAKGGKKKTTRREQRGPKKGPPRDSRQRSDKRQVHTKAKKKAAKGGRRR